MQYKLVYGVLSMAAYALAEPLAEPQGPGSNTGEMAASPTPIDITLDVGTLGKMFPLPPELIKLAKPGSPLELKVSLGKPGKHKKPKEEEDEDEERSSRLHSSINWEGGIELEESAPYTPYKGNGYPEQGWPTPEEWVTYRSMRTLNRDMIMDSCSADNWRVADNSPQETDQIFNAIERISQATYLDRRFILAVMLQETKGCVRVQTTCSPNGVRNPGLMQSHNGESMCNSGTWGAPKDVLDPCPEDKIFGMIYEGVVGTSDSPGDVSLLKMIMHSGTGSVADLYRAARLYNSGPSVSLWKLEEAGSGTPNYASDVANRMTGWVG